MQTLNSTLMRFLPRRLFGLLLCSWLAWLTATTVTAAEPGLQAGGWNSLFDGKSLSGWHKNPQKIGHGTGGIWTVTADGELTGEQDPPGSGNGGILLTDQKFGDFELSLEMKPTWGVDSGVFLRANDKGECIQMTVDYYDGGNIGQLYGEATGGWVARAFSIRGNTKDGRLLALRTIDTRPPVAAGLKFSCTPDEWLQAWKIDDWNTALIRVQGGRLPVVTTHINEVKVCEFDAAASAAQLYDRERVADRLGEKGSIALQVHGGPRFQAGAKCRWRNIRIREL